ncbi:3'-5' exonuclease [Streptomyces sp. APSN-46.1]|uniref:3'-5' exonuclease n=1 Tax=Streptomyces sp. APSN-46.1 TaxID=2929049 RepID=UPI001FB4277A|nr:3'-5' exonuclease [Streptomyces sp. APSN-46.1]MCJ1677053.1 3'-5' exonuclease [Streptomyces sp. APSN-46.1]
MNWSTWPRPLFVVDVEGNGANPPDLVEIAAVPVENGMPQPDGARTWLIRPPTPIPSRISRIHGITNEMTADAPTWPEIAKDVQELLDGAWICAHSASVEYGLLTRHMPHWQPAGVIDTLRLARAAFPGHKGFGLDALITHTGIRLDDVAGTRHRAGYDAHATALLLHHLATHYDTWDALAAHAVPPGMPGLTRTPEPEEQTLW